MSDTPERKDERLDATDIVKLSWDNPIEARDKIESLIRQRAALDNLATAVSKRLCGAMMQPWHPGLDLLTVAGIAANHIERVRRLEETPSKEIRYPKIKFDNGDGAEMVTFVEIDR